MEEIKITPLLDTLKLEKIDDEIYFSTKYSEYISNSRLSLINPEQDNDPKAFFEGLSKHSKYSDALLFGSAIHELSLQPEDFILVDCVDRPTAKLGFMCDELYSSFINDYLNADKVIEASDKISYYKGKMDDDKIDKVLRAGFPYWEARKQFEEFNTDKIPIYLDPKNRERALECLKALNNNNAIQKLLHPEGFLSTPISENEQAILLDLEVQVDNSEPFILKLKAKLDNYTIDFEENIITVNDIKTIGKLVSEADNNIQNFRYMREIAIYSWLLSLCAKKHYNLEDPIIKGNFLFVSTIPAYYTKIVPMTNRMYLEGWKEFVYLLKLVAHYYNKGYRFS